MSDPSTSSRRLDPADQPYAQAGHAGSSGHPRVPGLTHGRAEDSADELEQQLADVMRVQAAHPDVAAVTEHLTQRLRAQGAGQVVADRSGGAGRVGTQHARRAVVAGVLAGSIAIAGGAVAAAAPILPGGTSVVHELMERLGVDWSGMPSEYTREQYEAFWGAGYTQEDVHALEELWHTDETETKARAGQMVIEGVPVPVAPSDPELTEQHSSPVPSGEPG